MDTISEGLTAILSEIEAMEASCFPPRWKFDPQKERFLCECPDAIKKVFALSQMVERDLEVTKAEARYASPKDAALLEERANIYHIRAQFLSVLFWFLAKEQTKHYGRIGLRFKMEEETTLWFLVEPPEEPHSEFPPFLRNIFGQ